MVKAMPSRAVNIDGRHSLVGYCRDIIGDLRRA